MNKLKKYYKFIIVFGILIISIVIGMKNCSIETVKEESVKDNQLAVVRESVDEIEEENKKEYLAEEKNITKDNVTEKQVEDNIEKNQGGVQNKKNEEQIGNEENKNVCTISITCDELLSQREKLSQEKQKYIPQDGVILKATTIEIKDGESAFDILRVRLPFHY